MEIRNPKAEIRRKSEIRNPKAGIAELSGIGSALNAETAGAALSRSDRTERRTGCGLRISDFGFRPSDFLRISAFGFRIWAFGVRIFALLAFWSMSAVAEQRFPPPDFVETSHQLPSTATPAARGLYYQYLDVAVLAASLGVATWLVLGRRSRRGVVALAIFSVAYFGFYRKGCVCAIGSLQDVALALGDGGYAVPVGVLVFFVLPLAFALFAGRTFCAGVCPHGALQDLVLLKPVNVPSWLEHGLSIVPFVYLGAGVLFAATGSAFIICEYDPFVPVFRMSGRALMVLGGAGLLGVGVFVGRPYCRFLCPYGALLKLAGSVAKWRLRVTPDACTRCRLCEASCPFGAMRQPESGKPAPGALAGERRRLVWLLVLLPLLAGAGAWLGGRFSGPASQLHTDVSLAERFVRERDTPPKTGTPTPDDLSLERARQNPGELLAQAALIRHKFRLGGWLFGAWVGLVIGAKLISLSVHRQRTDYEPDRGACLSCARCLEYCPSELARRGIMPSEVRGSKIEDRSVPLPIE
jgi:ferredoxin